QLTPPVVMPVLQSLLASTTPGVAGKAAQKILLLGGSTATPDPGAMTIVGQVLQQGSDADKLDMAEFLTENRSPHQGIEQTLAQLASNSSDAGIRKAALAALPRDSPVAQEIVRKAREARAQHDLLSSIEAMEAGSEMSGGEMSSGGGRGWWGRLFSGAND